METVDSMDELKSSRSVACKNFTEFEMLDEKIASAMHKTVQKLPLEEECRSRGTDSSERGLVAKRKTDRLQPAFKNISESIPTINSLV